jgi:hypothetical protein
MNMHSFLSGTRRQLAVLPVALLMLTGATSAMAQVAPANPTKSTVNILVSGTVSGAPEAVTFSNAAVQIGSTLSRNSDPALPPVLIVDITFLKATGTGAFTKAQYVAEAQVTKIRPFKANEVIEVTFPFSASTAAGATLTTAVAGAPLAIRTAAMAAATKVLSEARSGRAVFSLTFDTNGAVTGATGTIGANTF